MNNILSITVDATLNQGKKSENCAETCTKTAQK